MDKKLKQIKNEALELCAPVFHEMEEISLYNTQKVLEAFCKHHLSAYHFAPSYGYGYDDPGRGKLEEIWCDVFKCEAALVRPQFVSGTHALERHRYFRQRSGKSEVPRRPLQGSAAQRQHL